MSPRDVVAVYIPEYVVEHWWEQLLHNQSALRLKARLLFQPGVMVTSVPWRLGREAGLGEAVAAPDLPEPPAPTSRVPASAAPVSPATSDDSASRTRTHVGVPR